MQKWIAVAVLAGLAAVGSLVFLVRTAPSGTGAPGDRPTSRVASSADAPAAVPAAPVASPLPGVEAWPAGTPAPRAASGAAMPAVKRDGGFGPLERMFFSDGAVNDRADSILTTAAFERVVDGLPNEAGAEGMALVQAYRGEFEDALRTVGARGRIDRFGCARAVCIGSIMSGENDWTEEWLRELHRDGRLPVPRMSVRRVRLPGGGLEVRFFFTTMSGGFVSGRR